MFCYIEILWPYPSDLFRPELIHQFLLDVHLFGLEVLGKQPPGHIEHLRRIQVHVDGQQLVCIILGKRERTVSILVLALAASAYKRTAAFIT